MKDRIILITGGTGGIGKAAALALAKQNFTVIIHGRHPQKTKEVCEEIKRLSGNNNIGFLIADLFLLADVRKMAETFKQKYDHLDVLINNAGGIMSKNRELTNEGIEKTLAVNLLAPFLLTALLIGSLQKGRDSRIINVSSSSHKLNAKPDFTDLALEKNYDPLPAYGNAKLFLIWITSRLAATLQQKGINISANTMHPGAVATNFGRESNLGSMLNVFAKLARLFFRPVEAGADTLVYLAVNNVPGEGGLYFVDRKPAKVSTRYYTQENEKTVWEYCERQTGLRVFNDQEDN